MGAQTAKGLSADAAEEAASETLVHKFVITAAKLSSAIEGSTNNKQIQTKTGRAMWIGGGRREGMEPQVDDSLWVGIMEAALMGIYRCSRSF